MTKVILIIVLLEILILVQIFFLEEEDLLKSTNNIYRIVEKKDIRNPVRKIEERNRKKTRQPKIYIYAKLSGIDLIEKFSLYSDQNQIFECKIKMRQRHVNKYVF